MMKEEIWKDIEGYEGKYQVSNFGRVRSFLSSHGNLRAVPLILAPRKSSDGYLRVALSKNGVRKDYMIHRLVIVTFKDRTNIKETVNHIDGNKENNVVDNLEWADRVEQMQHAYKLGLKKPVHTNRKLSAEDIKEIRKVYIFRSKEFGTVALAKKYGVTNAVIGHIVRGETYKEI